MTFFEPRSAHFQMYQRTATYRRAKVRQYAKLLLDGGAVLAFLGIALSVILLWSGAQG